ncbi:MAG: hypothetical protein SPL30_03120 [Succinivibrio sp.]|nr:hypothetical protein [Succinivibrio sp.]
MKELNELPLTSEFIFNRIFCNPDRAKRLIEQILDVRIAEISSLDTDESLIERPEKGVRFDIRLDDDARTQIAVGLTGIDDPEDKLIAHSRYCQVFLDRSMEEKYGRFMPVDIYLISLCNFAAFDGKDKRYLLESRCVEDPSIKLNDGVQWIILSSGGQDPSDVGADLMKFLDYLNTGKPDTEFLSEIDKEVRKIKADPQSQAAYMAYVGRKAEIMEKRRAKKQQEQGAESA